jgi:hypothetical protein
MKQLLFLFLFLLPCLAWAQYPSNGNQKITLGEQTTADGLIWRGVAADTTLTAKSDTAAYFVLDTVNINLYTYKASATGRKWRQLGADTAAIAYVNTYGAQTVNGAKTFTSQVKTNSYYELGNTSEAYDNVPGTLSYNDVRGVILKGKTASIFDFAFYTSSGASLLTNPTGTTDMRFTGNVRISGLAGSGSRGVNADANGDLSAASSILIKENVENINYGLSDVLKLNPVIFNYIDRNKWGEGKDLGFVAEDVMNVIPEATGVMNNSDIYFDLQKLIPVLTKAIQEQQALIKALEQRIINLENK